MAIDIRFLCLAVLLQCALVAAKADGLRTATAQAANPADLFSVLLNGVVQGDSSVAKVSHSQFCLERNDRVKCEASVKTMVPVLFEWLSGRLLTEELLPADKNAAVTRMRYEMDRISADCSVCKYLVNYAKASIESESSKEAISHATQEACGKLPSEFQETCNDVAARYEDLMLQYIKTTNAAEFCTSVGACKATALYPPLPSSLLKFLANTRPETGGSFCGTCKVAVTDAHSLIDDPDTQEEIVDFIKNSCETVVPMFADICTEYVDEYAPAVFALLDEYLNDDLCTTLGFCPAFQLDDILPSEDDFIAFIDEMQPEDEDETNTLAEQQLQEELRQQQEDMVAYVASLLLSEDIEAKSAGAEHVLRGGDRNAITSQMIKSLGLDARPATKADSKLPDWLNQESSAVVSRKLLKNQG